jgi:hypothetical protein
MDPPQRQRGKPLFEDEAIVGQISVHGIVSVLRTVIWDRGGAPLHFVLAHVVLLGVDSAAALRWLSVVAAVATLPVAFDLGRRVGGRQIGALAAAVCAASGLLDIRTDVPFWAQIGRSAALTAPRDWVSAHSRPGGVLYPYSVVYLRTLGRASESTSLRSRAREMPGTTRSPCW